MNIVTLILVIIGAVNWGLVGALDFNLVSKIFGAGTTATKVAYIIIGLAGLWCIKILVDKLNKK